MSDHRPVCAVMEITTRQVDWTRYKEMKGGVLAVEEERDKFELKMF